MMLVRRPEFFHLAAALTILLAGCSVPNSFTEDNTGAPAIRIDAAIPTFPIEAYMLTAEQTNYIGQAFTGIARQCMTRFGLTYENTGPPAVAVRLGDRRYGVTDTESVARYGYHLPPDSPQVVAQAQAEQYHKLRRTADDLNVLTGQDTDAAVSFPTSQPASRYRGIAIPAGGCLGEARRALDEDGPGSDFSLVDKLNLESFDQSQTIPSVCDATTRWSACMAAAGYSYPGPLAVPAAFDLRTTDPSERELGTALADVNCKSHTHLIDIWVAAETMIQNAAIHTNHTALTTIRDRMDRELRAADTITKGQRK